jgi:hypothetical protein
MTEPNDAAHRAEIMKYHPKAGFTDRARFAFQGYTAEPFVKTMWDRHRGK